MSLSCSHSLHYIPFFLCPKFLSNAFCVDAFIGHPFVARILPFSSKSTFRSTLPGRLCRAMRQSKSCPCQPLHAVNPCSDAHGSASGRFRPVLLAPGPSLVVPVFLAVLLHFSQRGRHNRQGRIRESWSFRTRPVRDYSLCAVHCADGGLQRAEHCHHEPIELRELFLLGHPSWPVIQHSKQSKD